MKIRKYFQSFVVAVSLSLLVGSVNVNASLEEDMVNHVYIEIPSRFEKLRERWPDGSQRLDLVTDGYLDKIGLRSHACMGFAVNMYEELFREFIDMEGSQITLDNSIIVSINELRPSDVVIYNGNFETDHAIVITKVIGDDIYYVDCNGTLDGSCIVRWDNHISRQKLEEKLKVSLVEGSNRGNPGLILQNPIVNFLAELEKCVTECN